MLLWPQTESLGYDICFIGSIQDVSKKIIEILKLPERLYTLFGLTIGFQKKIHL